MKIFIKEIDKSFNQGLLPVYINNNDIITNEQDICFDENKYLISQYSLEIFFYKFIKSYKNLTEDINECDIIYIPIYLFLLAWEKKYFYNVEIIIDKLNKFKDFIKYYTELDKPKKIMIVYSDVMWEDCRCFINYFSFKNVYFICYENVKDIYQNNQIPVPFITHIKCNPSNYSINFIKEKKFLISYAGRNRPEIKYFKNIEIIDLSKYQSVKDQWISYNIAEMYQEIDNLYKNSYYSLQPHGDKQTRKGFYNSLLLGCIPVIFENNSSVYTEIFKNYLNITDICIIIKNNQLNDIDNILKNNLINLEIMINNINKIKGLLLYSYDSNDILDYILGKINSIN